MTSIGPRTPASTVLLSGGLDSSTAMLLAVARGDQVEALFVDYGQAPAKEEQEASEQVTRAFGVPLSTVTINGFEVPEGEILGRNAMLVTVALMTVQPPAALVLGVHNGSAYWDCSREFLSRMQALLNGYSSGAIQLLAPFAAIDKRAVIALAREHGLDVARTYSCEQAGGPCGGCTSCRDMAALVG